MKPGEREISVVSLNHDRSVRKTWTAELVKSDPPLIELAGVFDRDVTHPSLGRIEKGTLTTEYFWLNRWYNVFRFQEPDGRLKYFYCNIAMPPTFADGKLEYVDLEIDVVARPDGGCEVLDEDDFDVSARNHRYSDELVKKVRSSLEELIAVLERKEFPFTHLS